METKTLYVHAAFEDHDEVLRAEDMEDARDTAKQFRAAGAIVVFIASEDD